MSAEQEGRKASPQKQREAALNLMGPEPLPGLGSSPTPLAFAVGMQT